MDIAPYFADTNKLSNINVPYNSIRCIDANCNDKKPSKENSCLYIDVVMALYESSGHFKHKNKWGK